MSKRWAGLAGLLGMIAGALVGLPYLSKVGDCAPEGTPAFSCTVNIALAPFIAASVFGFIAAIVIAHAALALFRRVAAPPSPGGSAPIAAETPDPSLQVAAWGMAPRSSRRVVDAIDRGEPVPRRPENHSLGSRGRPRPRPRLSG